MAFVFITLISAYVLFAAFVVYVFVIADPNESVAARYFTQTLPDKAWRFVSKAIGERNAKALEFVSERTLILVYCAVVFGAWSVVFFFVYPWIDGQDYVSKYHKWIGYAVFISCVLSWRLASTSSPGIITSKSIRRYDHYPYDNLLFVRGQMCRTRKIPKLPRSKFDRFKYKQNIAKFDHFCGWVYNTIGEENYRYFLLFLFVHVGMCVYGSVVVGLLFQGEILSQNLHLASFVDRFTGEEIGPSKWIVAQYLLNKYLFEGCVLLLMSVMALALGLFLAYHIYLTSSGMTTNEVFKWGQVKKWYKRELKNYNDALREGKMVINEDGIALNTSNSNNNICRQKSQQPRHHHHQTHVHVTDEGDVTCSSGVGGGEGSSPDHVIVVEDDSDCEDLGDGIDIDDPNLVRHPGPNPKNIYNRGLIENWKEVIFPISLRRERLVSSWTVEGTATATTATTSPATSFEEADKKES